MWQQTVLRLLALSAGGGIVCGMLHSFLRCVRLAFNLLEQNKHKAAYLTVVFVQDILFCIMSSCMLCAVLYYGNNGNFRLVSVFGMAVGFAAFKVSFGRLAEAAVDKLFSFVRKNLSNVFCKTKRVVQKIFLFVRNKKIRFKKRKIDK